MAAAVAAMQACASGIVHSTEPAKASSTSARTGLVRVDDHCLTDDNGRFLGLGVSYFTALSRYKHDRQQLESDLEFLSKQGFNYYRMLSTVGYHAAWDGLEIAPIAFTSRTGKRVEAWPDYWAQLRGLVDLAYDRYGLRTQITIFADAQLMPQEADRVEHLRRLLAEVVAGREHKIVLLEVANEAWQNGFPEDEGVAQLRRLAEYLNDRTATPVAITSNHDWPEPGSTACFDRIYAGAAADVATWHFSRDRSVHDGWKPVYDCWELAARPGCPPVSSNEPIGPGSSVDAEADPARLALAACFAYAAKLPMYVFHSEAGVFGRTRFQNTLGVGAFEHALRLLPGDLPSWERNDGQEPRAPFTAFAAGRANSYWPEVEGAADGCLRNIGGRAGDRFVCIPIGIRPGGLKLQARERLHYEAYDPLTGERVQSATVAGGAHVELPPGPGGLIVLGTIDAEGSR